MTSSNTTVLPAPSALGYVANGRHLNNGRETTETAHRDGMQELKDNLVVLWFDSDGSHFADWFNGYSVENLVASWPNAYDMHFYRVPLGFHASTYWTEEVRESLRHVWMRERFWFTHRNRWLELMPAPSKAVPGLISYYQTPAKRAANVRTPIKPGKFLQKFFADILTQEEIQALALKWSNQYAPRTAQITQDADVIEHMYRSKYNGSCMHFGDGGYAGFCHPARVYAGPDLGLAYLETDGVCDARAIVWPEKKIFGRTYGDHDRLRAALITLGYSQGYDADFEGARLQRLWDDEAGALVMPYVDVFERATDNGTWVVLMEDGELDVQNSSYTDGVQGGANTQRCPCCGDRVHEDNMTWIDSRDESICDDCCRQDYTYCELSHQWVADSDTTEVRNQHGYLVTYSEEAVRNNGSFFYCEGSKLWYSDRRYNSIEVDGETYEDEYASAHFIFRRCELDGTHHTDAESAFIKLNDAGDEWVLIANLPSWSDTALAKALIDLGFDADAMIPAVAMAA